MKTCTRCIFFFVMLACAPSSTLAGVPWQFADNTRYLAMGDSLAAGYGAIPATNGYAYQLYRNGAFDRMTNTLFANAAIPGVTTDAVLQHQLPQAAYFYPSVMTMSVGGNDLLAILAGANPDEVLAHIAANLWLIFTTIHTDHPDAHLFINNLYTIPDIPETEIIIPFYNQMLADIVAQFDKVHLVDIYSAFLDRQGLLLIDRPGAEMYQIHPTNAGYRVMADAFTEVIGITLP